MRNWIIIYCKSLIILYGLYRRSSDHVFFFLFFTLIIDACLLYVTASEVDRNGLEASCPQQNSFKNILNEQLLIESLLLWTKLASLSMFTGWIFLVSKNEMAHLFLRVKWKLHSISISHAFHILLTLSHIDCEFWISPDKHGINKLCFQQWKYNYGSVERPYFPLFVSVYKSQSH